MRKAMQFCVDSLKEYRNSETASYYAKGLVYHLGHTSEQRREEITASQNRTRQGEENPTGEKPTMTTELVCNSSLLKNRITFLLWNRRGLGLQLS
jgi:hypothetical protein